MKTWLLSTESHDRDLTNFLDGKAAQNTPRNPPAGLIKVSDGFQLGFSSPEQARGLFDRCHREERLRAFVGLPRTDLGWLNKKVFNDRGGRTVRVVQAAECSDPQFVPSPGDPYQDRLFVFEKCPTSPETLIVADNLPENSAPVIFDPIAVTAPRDRFNPIWNLAAPPSQRMNGCLLPPWHEPEEVARRDHFFSDDNLRIRRAWRKVCPAKATDDAIPALVLLWLLADEALLRDFKIERARLDLSCKLGDRTKLEISLPRNPDPVMAYRRHWFAPRELAGAFQQNPVPEAWRRWQTILGQDLPQNLAAPNCQWREVERPDTHPAQFSLTPAGVPIQGGKLVQSLEALAQELDSDVRQKFIETFIANSASRGEAEALTNLLRFCFDCRGLENTPKWESWKIALIGHEIIWHEMMGPARTVQKRVRSVQSDSWPRLDGDSGQWVLYDLPKRASDKCYEYSLVLPLGSIVQPAGYFELDGNLGSLDSDCELV